MCLGAVGNNLAEGRIMAKRRARWASVPGFGCWSVGGGPVPARDPQFMPAMSMKGPGLGEPLPAGVGGAGGWSTQRGSGSGQHCIGPGSKGDHSLSSLTSYLLLP